MIWYSCARNWSGSSEQNRMFSASVNFIFPTSRIMIHPYYIRRDAGSEDIINTDNIEIIHIHNMGFGYRCLPQKMKGKNRPPLFKRSAACLHLIVLFHAVGTEDLP